MEDRNYFETSGTAVLPEEKAAATEPSDKGTEIPPLFDGDDYVNAGDSVFDDEALFEQLDVAEDGFSTENSDGDLREPPEKKKRKASRVIMAVLLPLIGAIAILFSVYYFSPIELILSGNDDMTVSFGGKFEDPGCSSRFLGFDLGGYLDFETDVDTGACGEYCAGYSVTLPLKRAEVKRRITVVDDESPFITLNGEGSVTVFTPTYEDPGCSAFDACDGDITESVTVTTDYVSGVAGDFTFIYGVTDSQGNSAEAKRRVSVRDAEAPVLTLNGGGGAIISAWDGFNEPGYSAYDDFDGDVTSKVTVTGVPDTSVTGVFDVTYSVTDVAGNTASAVRTVTVIARSATVPGQVNGGGVVTDSTVYLTFDDGPSGNVTPRVLDILKQNNVKATFFLIGYSDDKKPIISRMIDEGHTVAIHGYSHDYATVYSSPAAFSNNIEKLHEKLIADFGYNTNILRFPGGTSATVCNRYCPGIMWQIVPMVTEQGYVYFDWNISSGDAAGGAVSAATIAANVKGSLRHNRTNVVLMHDAAAKSTTADAIQDIINYANNNGYSFAALSSYTTPVRHNIHK